MKLPKLTKYRQTQIRKNLQAIYKTTTKQEQRNGKQWYKTANSLALEIAQATGNAYTLETVAEVIAALSPRNKWERNILDAQNVLTAHQNGIHPNEINVCTFNGNKAKAFDIAQGFDQIKDTAKKTFAFTKNILLDGDFVTIDLWHLRACFGTTITTGLTPKAYETIQRITIQEAQKVGLTGYEFQAIIWEKIRTT